MKHIIQLLFFLFLNNILFGQDQKLDSICLNISSQEFALNELVSKNIHFDSISEIDQLKQEITLKVQVLDNSYFLLSNWLLKPDTITSLLNSGNSITEEVRGSDYVLGNRLIIQNNTDSITFVPIEDRKLVLVQEAKDSNGVWRPIEYFFHSTCGNSYSAFGIPPKKSAQFMIAKYCGDFKTKLRVKISLNQQIYTSEEFEGYVNFGQFKVSPSILREGRLSEGIFNKDAY